MATSSAEGSAAVGKKLLWRLCIDMDGEIKRPYTPSIEVVTRPGGKVKVGAQKVPTPDRLSVVLRSHVKYYYGVFGLRLPSGVNRKEITCKWDEDEQECVLEAPWHGAPIAAGEGAKGGDGNTTSGVPPPLLLMTGSRIGFGGFGHARFNAGGLNAIENYSTLFNSKTSSFSAGAISDTSRMWPVTSGDRNVSWAFNYLNINDIDLPYEIVDVKEEEKEEEGAADAPREYPDDFFDGDGHYERQYWFRNPLIKVNHYDGEPGGAGFQDDSPYADNPFGQEDGGED